jgi:hypothetical protein
MSSTTRRVGVRIGVIFFCLVVARAWADHAVMNDVLGVGIRTNSGSRHVNDVKGNPTGWGVNGGPSVQVFVLSAILAPAPTDVAVTAPAVATTPSKPAEAAADAKPTPQPRKRLKAADVTDGGALIGARRSVADLGTKERVFLQKLAADIEARCSFAMAQEKMHPVPGTTVRWIIEVGTRDGRIAVKQVTSPSNLATPDFFVGVMQALSPLSKPDPDLAKTFGEVVRLEVILS